MLNLEDKKFALEIARALDDIKSLAHHEILVRMAPKEAIQTNLMIAMSYKDEDIDTSRAAIYVGLMKKSGYDARRPRN